ncbi:unnamed protein product, partial [Closterium sp. NIES-53]
FGDEAERPRWAELLRSGVAIFDRYYDAILAAMYALSVSAEGYCYLCLPPDPGIEAAALGASESALPSTAPAEALHTFTLDSSASRCFFRDSTTLSPLYAPVPVRLADPSGGPVLARSSTVLPCPVVPSGSLSGLHPPSFSTNLVSIAALQDAMVTTTTPGGQRVSICTCTRTGRHLATFTHRPGSSLYTLATAPPPVVASAQVSASGLVAPPCSCRLLSHQTLLWHHRLGHPSLQRLRGMQSRLLVSGLPRSLPPHPPSPAPPCLPCVEGRQRATPHSSSFPPTTAPLQTLHMDVWGPAHVPDVLITWIRAVRLQLCKRFRQDLPVLRLHSDKGGEFSSDFLRDFCNGEGILQSFTLLASPQQNGIFEHRIGLVMELNLWPCVSLPETSPTLRWTGEVGDASVFRVWGSRAFVRDTSVDNLSARAISCVFLGFPRDAPGWQFYHPTSRCVIPSQDVTFDESDPFYRLFPYRTATPPPPPLFLAVGPAPVDPLPPKGPAPSGVSHVDPVTVPVEVAVGSGAARGAASGGAEPAGVEHGGAEPEGVEPGGAEFEGAESEGAGPRGTASSGGPASASARLSPRPEPLSRQQLREWFAQRTCLRNGAVGAGDSGAGDTGAGGAGVTAGAGGTRGAAASGPGGARVTARAGVTGGAAAAGPGGARTRGTGAAGTSGAGSAEAGDPTEPGGAGAGGVGAGGTGTGGTGARGAEAGGAGAGGAVSGGTAYPLPTPSPYTAYTGGLTKRREPASRPASPFRTGRCVPCPRPPPVPSIHAMALRPFSVPLRVPLPPPPESSLPAVPDPESDRARAAIPTVSRLLTTAVTVPSFESTAASSLVAELEDFECLAAAVPRFASMLLASEGDPDAPDIPTSRSYAEAVTGPYSSQWQAAMDAKMASWKSTGTYVDAVSLSRANIVDGMWIFRGVDYFQTFSPTPKMTNLWVLLHVAAQRDYKLHSLDFSTAFLQGSLHEEIWLRRPPGFTGTTLATLGFTPSTADPSLFLCTDTSLPSFHVLVYVDDLIFATADTEALTLVNSELQKRHTCTDLGKQRCYLGLEITRDRARRTITLTQSHMVHQVLQRFGFQFSSPQPTPLSTGLLLSAPPLDESVERSGPYPELVGCLITTSMGLVLGGRCPVVLTGHADASWVDDLATHRSSLGYTFSLGSGSVSWRSTDSSSVLSSSCEAEIYAGAMAAQELRWLTYLLTDLGEQPRSPPQRGQLRLAYVATRANTADIFTKALAPSDHQRFSTVLGLLALLFLTGLPIPPSAQPTPPVRSPSHPTHSPSRPAPCPSLCVRYPIPPKRVARLVLTCPCVAHSVHCPSRPVHSSPYPTRAVLPRTRAHTILLARSLTHARAVSPTRAQPVPTCPLAARLVHRPSRPVHSSPCPRSVQPARARPVPPAHTARPSRPAHAYRAPRPLSPSHSRALEFPTWLLRTELCLQSQRQDGDTLWAHVSGHLRSPPRPRDLPKEQTDDKQARFDIARTAPSVCQSRDAAARVALGSLLPESEEAHFNHVRSAHACFTVIKARYSTASSASLGRLFMSFLFPDLRAFSRTAYLIAHLHSLNSSYCAACTEAELAILPRPHHKKPWFLKGVRRGVQFRSNPRLRYIAVYLKRAKFVVIL